MLLQFEDFPVLFDLFPYLLSLSAATLSCRLTLNKKYIAVPYRGIFRTLIRRLLGGALPISRLCTFSLSILPHVRRLDIETAGFSALIW